MSGRRILLAVGVVALIAGGAGMARAAERSPAVTYPDDRGERALDALHAPSIPTALPGSIDTGNGWQVDGTCDAARSAFQAADAPVPAGAKLTANGPALLVDAPFGPSIIDFSDRDGVCDYRIARGPTVTLDGGGFDKVSGVARVGCALDGGTPYVAGTVSTPQGDTSFAAFKGGVFGGNGDMKGSVGAVKAGGLAVAFKDAQALETANVAITSADADGGVVVVTGDNGPVTITYRCTVALGDLLKAINASGAPGDSATTQDSSDPGPDTGN